MNREDAEINSSDATQYESDTRDFFDNLKDSGDYGPSRALSLSNLQRYSETYPTDFEGGFISGENGSVSGTLKSEDRVYYTTISVEEFEIASTDYDVIDDDEYDVDNSMPLVMAGGDVSKSNLSFGNTAEYPGEVLLFQGEALQPVLLHCYQLGCSRRQPRCGSGLHLLPGHPDVRCQLLSGNQG